MRLEKLLIALAFLGLIFGGCVKQDENRRWIVSPDRFLEGESTLIGVESEVVGEWNCSPDVNVSDFWAAIITQFEMLDKTTCAVELFNGTWSCTMDCETYEKKVKLAPPVIKVDIPASFRRNHIRADWIEFISDYYWHGEYCLKNETKTQCVAMGHVLERQESGEITQNYSECQMWALIEFAPSLVHPDLCPDRFNHYYSEYFNLTIHYPKNGTHCFNNGNVRPLASSCNGTWIQKEGTKCYDCEPLAAAEEGIPNSEDEHDGSQAIEKGAIEN